MATTKIQSTHCERIAFVYVRQSTPLQVVENRESTERQYHLRERAIELGWPPSQVEVIDEDQGRSGSTAAHRTGFQRLATEVSLGKVGIVFMLEASRLARNNSDWYRLIEICGVSGTLIADESAVYNPREPNDREGDIIGGGAIHSADTVIRGALEQGSERAVALSFADGLCPNDGRRLGAGSGHSGP